MLADMYRLPIGMLQIVCPHATKGLQAMDLKRVAAYFIAENCRNCPHHEELSADNAGREILRESEQVREERATSADSAASPAKLRLRGLVSGDLTAALRSASTTEQSVIELVALLDDEAHADGAAEKLRQAAELAPEFFPDIACEVIAEHMADVSNGQKCTETLRTLGAKRGQLPAAAVRAALQCAELPFCQDEALALLADHFATGGELPHAGVIARIIGHQTYGADGFPPRRIERRYPGQTNALLEIGRRDLERLADACEKRLENPSRDVRVGTSMTLRKLLPALPALGPLLSNALLASLSLDDERFGRSADVEASRALADIFAHDPEFTQTKLATAFASADEEVKKLIFRVYRSVEEAAGHSDKESENTSLAVKCLPVVLDVLIPAVTSGEVPLEVRKDAAETVASIARKHPSTLLPRADVLLGAMAIVSREEIDFAAANPGGDLVLLGLPRAERQEYDMIGHHLSSALKELAEDSPAVVWKAVAPVFQSLCTTDKTEAALKARLLPLFVPLSRNHTTAPQLVPELFKALMAMDSVLVRVTALDVVEDLLRYSPELIPDDMREIVVVYLRDIYVAVHRAAGRAVSIMPMASKAQATEVARWLFAQFQTYAKQESGSQHCRELANELTKVCRDYADLRVNFALLAVLKQCQETEYYNARDAIENLCELAHDDPILAALYVSELLKFFARFPGHNDDRWPYSLEHQLFLSLFEQPASAISGNLAKFRETIRAAAKAAPFEALQFISVLLHHEHYLEASAAAMEVAAALPPGARHDGLRLQAELTAAMARAEAKIITGDSTTALAELRTAESIFAKYDTHSNRNEPDTINEALSVADRVAERIE